ncbi:hypothetical protein HanRHA438_Chr12g0544491 [Helianthus annuus]|nr:hypothetical protein HanRHA438_Chr12g0544491 [Helianthus annuus]
MVVLVATGATRAQHNFRAHVHRIKAYRMPPASTERYIYKFKFFVIKRSHV